MMSDHILFTYCKLQPNSISQIIGYLKRNSINLAIDISVSTVGLNTATVQKYVREQEKEDQIMDKLKTKEYVDPFKGSK